MDRKADAKRGRRARRQVRGTADDRVDEALSQSFPASDSPPWTLGQPAWASTLHAYCHHRLIVLNARASASDAALAMEANGIGAILVTDEAEIVGIVTDRDLAVRVVGERRDPGVTRLGEIMSPGVAALAPQAAERDVLHLMRDRRVRRVPLVENGRVVGMVTLDDLLLERAVTLEDVAEVVRAQLGTAGPARTRVFDEWRSFERRYARGLKTWTQLAARVQAESGLESRERAERAIEIVLTGIVRSLGPDLAARLTARLPAMVQAHLLEVPGGPHERVTRAGIARDVAADLSVEPSRAAAIVDAVGACLGHSIQASDAVGRRLPSDLRSLFRPAQPRRAVAREHERKAPAASARRGSRPRRAAGRARSPARSP